MPQRREVMKSSKLSVWNYGIGWRIQKDQGEKYSLAKNQPVKERKLLERDKQLYVLMQGAKKIIFTACHSGKLKLAFTSPDVISTSPKNLFDQQNWFHSSSVIRILQKNITCPSGKLKTEFTSPVAKSTSPGLSDTTWFARCDDSL